MGVIAVDMGEDLWFETTAGCCPDTEGEEPSRGKRESLLPE